MPRPSWNHLLLALALLSGQATLERCWGAPVISTPQSASEIREKGLLQERVTPELQERILDSFSEGNCDKVRAAVSPNHYRELRATVLAALAFCAPIGQLPEELFAQAEEQDPSNALIYVLHARYRWKSDPASAEPLWKKVLLFARNLSITRMAQEYLSGNGEGEEKVKLNDNWVYYADLQIGVSQESNPTGISASSREALPSGALNSQMLLSAQKSTSFGSISGNYSLLGTSYFSTHPTDLLENNLDAPIAVHAGSNEDVVFRPFMSFTTLGNIPYQGIIGVGVLGVAYRSNYKQSVQGSIFVDRLFPGASQRQDGTHFRFEYNWELFPPSAYIKLLGYIEHVQADQDIDEDFTFSYSHSDIGFQTVYTYEIKRLTLGIAPRILFRQDSVASKYLSASDQSPITSLRHDIQIGIQPNLTFSIIPHFQVYAWYEWSRNYSNIGPDDYADLNSTNQIIGLALKVFLANYN